MKFVKEHLTVLICAVVALLLVVAAFVWPVPSWIADVKAGMSARLADRQKIKQVTTTSLLLPGQPERKGIPSEEFIKAKTDSIDRIDKSRQAVEKEGQAANARGRVVIKGRDVIPLLPVPGKGQGIEEAGYLPKIKEDPAKYKADYLSLARLWTGLLSTGTAKDVELNSAMPPDPSESAKGSGGSTFGSGAPVAAGSAEAEAMRTRVMNKAASLRMYVDRAAFQTRAWALTDNAPDETQIFDSLVDSWLQSDVTKAIVATNLLGNPNATDTKQIGKSAVKRLSRIVIGSTARTHLIGTVTGSSLGGVGAGQAAADAGALFVTAASLSGLAGGAPPPAAPGATDNLAEDQLPPNEIHFEYGLSGRSTGRSYDMVLMSILVDIDPAKLNAFVDELYKQNMGYTVSSIQTKTVDPLDRASNGYLYGEGQVVEAEIQVECLLFRSWTRPIMPAAVSTTLGIPAYVPPAAPATPATAPDEQK